MYADVLFLLLNLVVCLLQLRPLRPSCKQTKRLVYKKEVSTEHHYTDVIVLIMNSYTTRQYKNVICSNFFFHQFTRLTFSIYCKEQNKMI